MNSHGIAGLSAALDVILERGVEDIQQMEHGLMRKFYEGVKDIDGVTVYGDFTAPVRGAIVTLNIRDYDSSAVSDALSENYGIATRPGPTVRPGCTGLWAPPSKGRCALASPATTRSRR